MSKIAMIAQTARNASPQPKEKPLKAKAALDQLDSFSRRDGAAA